MDYHTKVKVNVPYTCISSKVNAIELRPIERTPKELSPKERSPKELSPKELSPKELSPKGYHVNECVYEKRIKDLWLPGIGSGQSENVVSYITNLGYIYRDDGDGYDHNHKHLPEVLTWYVGNRLSVYKPVKLNSEYIELLKLWRSQTHQPTKWNPLFFQICEIYAKYNPSATEHFVVDDMEYQVNETTVNDYVYLNVTASLKKETRRLMKERLNYTAKIKEIKHEKLKMIFSMFILRIEKKNNKHDIHTISGMINRCKKKEKDMNDKLHNVKEQRAAFEKFYSKKVTVLIDIANNINEINEELEDVSGKSSDIFNIIKVLKEQLGH